MFTSRVAGRLSAAFGIGLLALVGVASIGGSVVAQDATPTPSTGTTETVTEEAERNEFLDAFAANLGVTDQATVDAAIQATIDQLLDEAVAAGDLTQAESDVIRERFESGEYRIGGFGIFRHGPGGFHDFDGPGGHHHRDHDRDGDKDDVNDDPETTPATESTPAAVSTTLI